MKQLYAIRASGGSYDDSWETTKFVTDDHEKAQVYCERMNAFRDVLLEKRKEISEWNVQWRKINPAPECKVPQKKEIPSWPSNKKVTLEMRAERKRIQEENNKAHQDAMKPYYDWHQRCYTEWIAWQQATYSAEILRGLNDNLDDSYWDVEPVDWLE